MNVLSYLSDFKTASVFQNSVCRQFVWTSRLRWLWLTDAQQSLKETVIKYSHDSTSPWLYLVLLKFVYAFVLASSSQPQMSFLSCPKVSTSVHSDRKEVSWLVALHNGPHFPFVLSDLFISDIILLDNVCAFNGYLRFSQGARSTGGKTFSVYFTLVSRILPGILTKVRIIYVNEVPDVETWGGSPPPLNDILGSYLLARSEVQAMS